ncbi:hypothetical protein Agabi119p4_2369 [Agaricus bisporus var. burnettii]|uniref:Integrase catalytic domain-containing protein n=1 Tax=Agaricus bisporus var. burnettii TaxID=192524 RepID=A0A8H7F937_AGABI|nr:hypothetical protein Agabi119p4_2369 [Agaricus bisporus var. burnettii]
MYLDGTAANPVATPGQSIPTIITTPPSPTTATTTTTSTSPETPWESTTPSTAEWRVRNAWTMGLLIYNTIDPIGLGISISGTAAEAWKSYLDTYEVASEIATLNAEMELRNMKYTDGQDFTEFISRLRTKWSNANALGAKIDDKGFRTIILSALPRSWDSIVATLYTTQTSREAISQLLTHWARISRDRVTTSQTTSALQTTTQSNNRDRQRNQNSQLVCTNQNCSRRGHTIEFCYWPGGGKAGQFPAGFGRRGGARGNASNTTTGGYQTSANNTTTNEKPESDKPQVFALAVITDITDDAVKVPSNLPIQPSDPNTSLIPTPSVSETLRDATGKDQGVGVSITSSKPTVALLYETVTLLDSGASDHCFINKASFSTYDSISPPRQGNSAGKGSTFGIEGVREAEIFTPVNGVSTKIILAGALHTPQLRSNLISISKLVSRGSSVSFEGDSATVRNHTGNIALVAVKENGLYVVPPTGVHVNVVQSKRKAVSLEVWHRRLGHISVEVIKRMLKEDLVDGLSIAGSMEMKGLCEDCIFGKHTSHPYNNPASPENHPLKRVYIDLWGPSPVQSAGGQRYFMLIIDGATSYRKLYFLTTKSVDATLMAFKEFHKEAERQTGKTLKEVRLDMGREWYNKLWSTYVKAHGIVLNFTTPYAHQQNGKAERSMRTLLDMARTSLADSGLPQKYWADAVQTAAYVRNLTPTTGSPTNIPSQRWFGQRQDISHLCPFGSTAYAHIPAEIHSSKLSPRSSKLTLIGYYGHTGYKLLDRTTGAAYKSRDVIFEESRPHLSTDPITSFSPNDSTGSQSTQQIAPRPKAIDDLHTTSTPTSTSPSSAPTAPTATPNMENTSTLENLMDPPPALRRSRRETKPSQRDFQAPRNYREAMKNSDMWLDPMLKELNVMREKQVFRLVPRPVGKNVVKSRWVFANKYDEAGAVVNRKARLVAKGFTQVIGEDYDETYASVARLESVRMVCAVAASRGLRLWQVDFVSAFLNSENSFEVYMEQPPGFEEGGDHVWLLLKTLYGTMQGAHDWAQTLDRTYAGHGYYISKADPQTDDVLGALSTAEGETKAKDELC